jgi:hypothetical protein
VVTAAGAAVPAHRHTHHEACRSTRKHPPTAANTVRAAQDSLLLTNQERYCTPTRWWDKNATVTVADCHDPDFQDSRLWLVPTDGGTPTALTEPNSGQEGEVLGAATAWLLPEGTYVQALGACGYRFLAKRDDVNRTLTKVSVPNVDDHKSVDVLGVYHGHLELQASLSYGDGDALLDYDPAAGTSTVLLGPTVNGGVVDAMVYPGYE